VGVLIFIWATHIYLDETSLYPRIVHFFNPKESSYNDRDELIEEIPNTKANSRIELMQNSAFADPQ
jgi:hypothetical protein